MKFIKEHKIASIILLLVLIFTVTVVLSYKNFGKSDPLSSAVTGAYIKVSKPLSSAANSLRSSASNIFNFRKVASENEKLRAEKKELEAELVMQQMKKEELIELRELSKALNYEPIKQAQNYVGADIVSMDNSNIFNGFTISRGAQSGIAVNNMVVNGDGLVGRISQVDSEYSKVMSIIDERNNVSFMVQRDMSIIGIVKGNGKGKLEGFTIDGKAEIIKGDVVLTSGIGNYPAGIKIGKISKVKYSSDTQLKTVVVEPSVDFNGLYKVLVVQ